MRTDDGLKNSELESISNFISFSGFVWKLKPVCDETIKKISSKYNLSHIMSTIISNRPISIDSIDLFINPKLKNLMPDPFLLSDMDKAVDRIIKAIENHEHIGIFGDYDVDGATSSALFYKFFTMIGHDSEKISVHIPDRIDEGYGLNIENLQKLKEENCTLVLAVDCGITSVKEIEWATANNLEIIIIDHHQPEGKIPTATAVVDPKKENEVVDFSYLAAVGVCFFTAIAIHTRLQQIGYYKKNLMEEPNLLLLMDLVALGTVCDVVPTIGVNRAFINTGLQVLSNRTNIGLKELCNVSSISTNITPYHLGFVLGPRINAGGRVGDSSIGVKLLCSKNPITARNYAEKLTEYNDNRREIESKCACEAIEKIDDEKCKSDNMVFITGKDWHTGVIGIVSGRIKEKYNLPTFVSTIEESTGLANGSARSVNNVNIGDIIIKAKTQGVIIEGGGHYMAAGFTYYASKEKDFYEFLKSEIAQQLNGNQIQQIIEIDSVIDISAVNMNFAKEVSKLSPYGEKNPEPIFLITNVRLVKSELVKNEHIRCVFSNSNGKSLYTMCFKSVDTKMGKMFLNHIGKSFNVVGKIRINNYKGIDSASFILEDANFVSELAKIQE